MTTLALALASVAAAADPASVVAAAVAARAGVPLGDVTVQAIALPDAAWSVELPDLGSLCGGTPVVLRATVDGRPVRHSVRAAVDVLREVPVAARDTAAGEEVALSTARVSCDRLRTERPADPATAWVARTALRAGDPVTTARVRPRPDARDGADVALWAGTDHVRVTAPGRLSGDAFVGERVHVINLATRTQQTGIYQADGTVRLTAGGGTR